MQRRRGLIAGVLAAVAAAALAFWLWGPKSEGTRTDAAPASASVPPTPDAPAADHRKSNATAVPVTPIPSAPRSDAGTSVAVPGTVVVSAGWGAGLFDLGRDRPEQGNPEGPMSFALDPQGNPLVLDQVNGRIVRYRDGKPADTVPTPQQAPQDLAVAKDGSLLVLDRLSGKSVAIMGPDGRLRGELPIEGTNVAEGGAVTGVFSDGKDVYVEREHGALVKVGDTDGKPDAERPEIPGRPTRDGTAYINAVLENPQAGLLTLTAIEKASMSQRFTRQLRLPEVVDGVLLLDTDAAGIIYLAVLAERQGQATNGEAAHPQGFVHLVCLEGTSGRPVGQNELPVNDTPEETFRDFAVLDAGGVIYAFRTERGVNYQRYDCH